MKNKVTGAKNTKRLGKLRPFTKENIEKYCPEHGVAIIRDKDGNVLYVEAG